MAELLKINLAMQGGGAHGAFTWGVVDRLLREDDIQIAAVSGTSAGALNAVTFKSGFVRDGNRGAIEALDNLWAEIAGIDLDKFPQWAKYFFPEPAILSRLIELSPAFAALDAATRLASPYLSGPFYENPLESILNRINFEDVRSSKHCPIFLSATNVRSGKIKVFRGAEVTPKAVMASACLPTLFRAVEIEDPKTKRTEAYWDGGYTGNPALYPLFKPELPNDIVIININPLHRDALPVTPQEIQNRINEVSFNASLLSELRAINFVARLIRDGMLAEGEKSLINVHMIADDDFMNQLSVATKLIPNASVIDRLKTAGQNAAEAFLQTHKDKIGKSSSFDLGSMFRAN